MFYIFDTNTLINYYFICEYNHITIFIEAERVEINERWVDILSAHMRLNGDVRYLFIHNSKKEL
jgi:hypothetical protein